jgi:uncharacterized protein (TIGR02145 family)
MKSVVILFSVFAIILIACKKEGPVTLPTVSTASVSGITPSSAQCGGDVTADGGAQVTSKGVCFSTSQMPTTSDTKTTDGSGLGIFNSNITGLDEYTTYYVRGYAINSEGTNCGTQVSFKTLPAPVYDIEGNKYNALAIGNQIWIQENLKTTKLNDNTAIPQVTDNTAWENLTSPGYCYYDNDETTFRNTFGALYNWYSVYSGKLCPTGWHVPTEDDWNTLISTLGGESIAGGKLKAMGTIDDGDGFWYIPNVGPNNESKFTAHGGGARTLGGGFLNIYAYSNWLTSTEYSSSEALYFHLGFDIQSVVKQNGDIRSGLYVRCVKD